MQCIAPEAARRYALRRWQFDSRRIYVRPRTVPQSAHLWWPAVAKLQAASVPIAYRLEQRDRQPDESSRYRLLPTDGGRHNNYLRFRPSYICSRRNYVFSLSVRLGVWMYVGWKHSPTVLPSTTSFFLSSFCVICY